MEFDQVPEELDQQRKISRYLPQYSEDVQLELLEVALPDHYFSVSLAEQVLGVLIYFIELVLSQNTLLEQASFLRLGLLLAENISVHVFKVGQNVRDGPSFVVLLQRFHLLIEYFFVIADVLNFREDKTGAMVSFQEIVVKKVACVLQRCKQGLTL